MKNIFVLFLLWLTACPAEPHFAKQTFIAEDILETTGNIPLVLVALNFPREMAVTTLRTNEYYETLYVGEDWYNVREYLENASYGNFSFDFLGVWGPFDIPMAESFESFDHQYVYEIAMSNLELSGFDFESYDTNQDGLITEKELLIVLVDNGSLRFGATRYGEFTTQRGTEIFSSFSFHGAVPDLTLVVHEITHLFWTADIYGSSCNSYLASLLSCSGEGRQRLVAPDPWHRIQLNWIEPRYVDVENMSGPVCYNLQASQFNGIASTEAQRPLVVYEASRGYREYFIVEFRNPSVEYLGVRNYDQGVPYAGVGIWSVKLSTSNRPYTVKSIISNDMDSTIWMYSGHYLQVGTKMHQYKGTYFWISNESVQPVYQNGTSAKYYVDIGFYTGHDSEISVCITPIFEE